jgi:hypothetical protein
MSDYLRFETVIMERLNEEGQYVSRFVDGALGCPELGTGLRFKGNSAQFVTLKIHRDDVDTFIERYLDYKEQKKQQVLRTVENNNVF